MQMLLVSQCFSLIALAIILGQNKFITFSRLCGKYVSQKSKKRNIQHGLKKSLNLTRRKLKSCA